MTHSVEHLRKQIREEARSQKSLEELKQEGREILDSLPREETQAEHPQATLSPRPTADGSLAELGLWLALTAAIIFGGLAATAWAIAWLLRSLARSASRGWQEGKEARQR